MWGLEFQFQTPVFHKSLHLFIVISLSFLYKSVFVFIYTFFKMSILILINISYAEGFSSYKFQLITFRKFLLTLCDNFNYEILDKSTII